MVQTPTALALFWWTHLILPVQIKKKLQLHIVGEYFRSHLQQRNVFTGTSGYSVQKQTHPQLCPNLLRNEDGCTNAQGVFMDGGSLPEVCVGTDGAGGCARLSAGTRGGGGVVWGALLEHHSECDHWVWRRSEKLECLDGNSTLFLPAVWMHLRMNVCGVFFLFH